MDKTWESITLCANEIYDSKTEVWTPFRDRIHFEVRYVCIKTFKSVKRGSNVFVLDISEWICRYQHQHLNLSLDIMVNGKKKDDELMLVNWFKPSYQWFEVTDRPHHVITSFSLKSEKVFSNKSLENVLNSKIETVI